jgi:predicted DNA-binding transcriptional regulator YafY
MRSLCGVLGGVGAVLRSVEIFYQSMNRTRPEPIWRRITPHAFGHDGLRWHVRAYCHIDSKFKDFILSRTFKVRDVLL